MPDQNQPDGAESAFPEPSQELPQLQATVISPEAALTDDAGRDRTGTNSREDTSRTRTKYVGRYRLVGELGAGGFGQVYLAHDDSLNRPVALKVLKRASACDTDASRESSLLAAMHHPGIAEVFDTGCDADHGHFIVTRFIDGQPLATVLANGPIDSIQCARWALQVACALQHAHSHGITHRDIKPANLMITGDGRAVVLDFGVALLDSDLRSTVDYSGTPAWMSPEQAAGRGKDIDGRSDIFSLGCVFYEMLTGVRAFRGTSRVELLAQIQTTEPRPPRQIRADRPVELESICLRCLRKAREDRFATAADLAAALEQAISKLEGSDRTSRANPVTVAAGIAVAIAIMLIVWWQIPPGSPDLTPSTPSAVVVPSTDVLAEMKQILIRMEKADARRNAGLPEATDVDSVPVADEEVADVLSVPVLPAGFEDIQKELSEAIRDEDHDEEFSVLLKASNQLIEDRHYAIAEQVTRRMVAISKGNPAQYPIACGELGMALYKRGKFDAAVRQLNTAIGIYQPMYDKLETLSAPQVAAHLSQLARMIGLSWMRIGNAHKFAENYDEAGEAYRTAMRLFEKHDRDGELLTLLLNYGSMESQQGNHLTAKALLTQGVDVANRLDDRQARAEMQLNLANANSRSGDNKAATQLYEEIDAASAELNSYELRSKLLLNFAESLLEEGRTAEAREKLLQLQQIVRPGDKDADEALKLLKTLTN